MKFLIAALFASAVTLGMAAETNAPSRWVIDKDGGITWNVKPQDAHDDNVEMSGKKVSVIVTYGVDDTGNFYTRKLVVFPTFRTVPVNTRSHISHNFTDKE